jgi:hypothetical protein
VEANSRRFWPPMRELKMIEAGGRWSVITIMISLRVCRAWEYGSPSPAPLSTYALTFISYLVGQR